MMPAAAPGPVRAEDAELAAAEAFIARWDGTAMAERANCAPFLSELCDVLGLRRPDPASGSGGDYRFERGVTRQEDDGSTRAGRMPRRNAAQALRAASSGTGGIDGCVSS